VSLLIEWCGFLGAWLLVAGPVYQASLELADEEFERSDMERALDTTPAPPAISRWWLLLPPVGYALHVRRRRRWRHTLIGVLTRSELERLLHFGETATAWLFVASGASLLAIKETWSLREAYEWPTAAFVAIVVVMVLACVANTFTRVRRRQALLDRAPRD
jgi:hypothetical protein